MNRLESLRRKMKDEIVEETTFDIVIMRYTNIGSKEMSRSLK